MRAGFYFDVSSTYRIFLAVVLFLEKNNYVYSDKKNILSFIASFNSNIDFRLLFNKTNLINDLRTPGLLVEDDNLCVVFIFFGQNKGNFIVKII